MSYHDRDHWFHLDDTPTVISFSGGRTSAYMLHEHVRVSGDLPDNTRVIFQNTGREHPATLDFVRDVGEWLGIDIVWLEYAREDGPPIARRVTYETASRRGEPFAHLIRGERGFLPSHSRRFCTRQLKILTARRWLVSQGWDSWWSMTGIRFDEDHRLGKRDDDRRIRRLFPLWHASVTKGEVEEFWTHQNVQLRLPDIGNTDMPNPWGNCTGCFLKSEANLARLLVERPEEFAQWEADEAAGNQYNRRRTYAEIRRLVELRGYERLSRVGALCQASEGECTDV